jgi:hypothetical protein
MRRGDAVRSPRDWVWRAAFRIAAGELQERGRWRSMPFSHEMQAEAPDANWDLLEGVPTWLITFDGTLCRPGTGPTQPPGSSPHPIPSCITAMTDFVDGRSGKVGSSLGGSIPGW